MNTRFFSLLFLPILVLVSCTSEEPSDNRFPVLPGSQMSQDLKDISEVLPETLGVIHFASQWPYTSQKYLSAVKDINTYNSGYRFMSPFPGQGAINYSADIAVNSSSILKTGDQFVVKIYTENGDIVFTTPSTGKLIPKVVDETFLGKDSKGIVIGIKGKNTFYAIMFYKHNGVQSYTVLPKIELY